MQLSLKFLMSRKMKVFNFEKTVQFLKSSLRGFREETE